MRGARVATWWVVSAGLVGCGHGLSVPSYEHVNMRHQALADGHPHIARWIHYGDSVEGRPLRALRIAQMPLVADAKSALVIGTLHGDEYMNIVDRLSACGGSPLITRNRTSAQPATTRVKSPSAIK